MSTDEDLKYAEQTAAIKRRFDPIMTEPIPARMYLKSPGWIEYARAAVVLAAGIAIGLAIPAFEPEHGQPLVMQQLPIRAAQAHLVYSPEVRHPVEVDAKQQDHLVKWLSKRLDVPLKVPSLTQEGFELLGGRLLPGGQGGPVAQFMYQDAAGKRLTLYVTPTKKVAQQKLTSFRFAKEGNVSVFYWIDDDCGYAISGEVDKTTLAKIASLVYKQLES